MDDSDKVRRILKGVHTIAVVGLSAQWHRPSNFAAKYLQEHGYRVIPVNPKESEILGERCYKSLLPCSRAIGMHTILHCVPMRS